MSSGWRSLIALLSTLSKNAVPAAGFLTRDWEASNAILLYLGENVVAVMLAALTVHFLAPVSENIDGETRTRRDALRTFLLVAGPFTFGAAVITVAVMAAHGGLAVRLRELLAGLLIMLTFQLFGFAMNLGRRGTTLRDSENMLVGVLGRVFLLAFAVWAGIFFSIVFPDKFIVPFIALKTLADLWRLRPDALRRRALVSL